MFHRIYFPTSEFPDRRAPNMERKKMAESSGKLGKSISKKINH